MTDIAAVVATLTGIHQRAPWAHSLTYDRPAHALDPHRTWTTGTGTDDRPPAGHWDDHGNITSHADTEAGRRWNELIRHLKGAHHDLTATLQHTRGHRILDPHTNPLDRPRNHVTARHIQRACTDLITLLRPIHTWHHTPDPLTAELARIADAVDQADHLFPAELFNPPQPVVCRNPRGNDHCARTLAHHARQLCAPCVKLEDDIAAERARLATQRGCSKPRCTGLHHAKGLCDRHYKRVYRSAPLATT